MSPKPYRPHRDGMPARVLAFFAANTDEELSTRDIATKYTVAHGGVQTALTPAVGAGLLRHQVRHNLGLYSAGPALHAQAAVTQQEAP